MGVCFLGKQAPMLLLYRRFRYIFVKTEKSKYTKSSWIEDSRDEGDIGECLLL